MAGLRCNHSFGRRVRGELLAWAGGALVVSVKVQPFKVFVPTRDLKDSLRVDIAFRTVSVSDLDLGTFHVEDQCWL